MKHSYIYGKIVNSLYLYDFGKMIMFVHKTVQQKKCGYLTWSEDYHIFLKHCSIMYLEKTRANVYLL